MDDSWEAAMLAAWDEGAGASPARRALLLLALAAPDEAMDELVGLPLGGQNRRILQLRVRFFGASLHAVTECPECAIPVEVTLDARELLSPPDPDSGSGGHAEGSGDASLPLLWEEMEGGRLGFRVPTVGDVLALSEEPGASGVTLLERCLERGGDRPATLSEDIVERIAVRMAEEDPLAELELALACPDCGAAWSVPLDLPAYLWSEVDGWARRTLDQIHGLALAYGWTEGETLSLPPRRRRAYLERIQDSAGGSGPWTIPPRGGTT
jgi:hypothetical protein